MEKFIHSGMLLKMKIKNETIIFFQLLKNIISEFFVTN